MTETNTAPAATAPVPNVPTSAPTFSTMSSTTASIMLTFDTSPNPGRTRAAHREERSFRNIPAASGSSIVSTSGRRSGHGSAARPGINRGSATGMNTTLPTMSSSISPTENARSPFANSASFGRNGAPAAPPRSSSPTAYGWSSRNSSVSPKATAGAMTKFAATASSTSRARRSGAARSRTPRPSPAAAMQVTTKTRTATFDTLSRNSATAPPSRVRPSDPLVVRHGRPPAVRLVVKPPLDGPPE